MNIILTGLLFTGKVDQVEDKFVSVEYQINNNFKYTEVSYNKNICVPIEGQLVIFNYFGIIKCLDLGDH